MVNVCDLFGLCVVAQDVLKKPDMAIVQSFDQVLQILVANDAGTEALHVSKVTEIAQKPEWQACVQLALALACNDSLVSLTLVGCSEQFISHHFLFQASPG